MLRLSDTHTPTRSNKALNTFPGSSLLSRFFDKNVSVVSLQIIPKVKHMTWHRLVSKDTVMCPESTDGTGIATTPSEKVSRETYSWYQSFGVVWHQSRENAAASWMSSKSYWFSWHKGPGRMSKGRTYFFQYPRNSLRCQDYILVMVTKATAVFLDCWPDWAL